MNVLLTTHQTGWLGLDLGLDLFISRRRLALRKKLPRAKGSWSCDSGGFSELSLFGEWRTSPQIYASEVLRYRAEIGNLHWAAIQDWMCEPDMLKKTGLSVREHQLRTVQSLETLQDLAPLAPWAPVLQGWEPDDYLRHLDLYQRRGHNLFRFPVVGVGSVCRRQNTKPVELLIRRIAASGLRLHGFGFKLRGAKRVQDSLVSSDSLAWSYNARKHPPLPGCPHKSCANCVLWATRWHARVVQSLRTHRQTPMPWGLSA